MPKRSVILTSAVVAALLFSDARAQPVQDQNSQSDIERGRVLYDDACLHCHTMQPDWRAKQRLVHSWGDLLHQVNRWQAVAGQNWEAAQVRDVSSYLNERFYYFPAHP